MTLADKAYELHRRLIQAITLASCGKPQDTPERQERDTQRNELFSICRMWVVKEAGGLLFPVNGYSMVALIEVFNHLFDMKILNGEVPEPKAFGNFMNKT
jgi:hypothetical protein